MSTTDTFDSVAVSMIQQQQQQRNHAGEAPSSNNVHPQVEDSSTPKPRVKNWVTCAVLFLLMLQLDLIIFFASVKKAMTASIVGYYDFNTRDQESVNTTLKSSTVVIVDLDENDSHFGDTTSVSRIVSSPTAGDRISTKQDRIQAITLLGERNSGTNWIEA